MKQDLDLIKNMLLKLENSEATFAKIDDLHACAESEELFINNYLMMIENKFVSGQNLKCDMNSVGLFTNTKGIHPVFGCKIRITENGRKMLSAMKNDQIHRKLKSHAAEFTLATLYTMGKDLVVKAAETAIS